MPLNILFLIHPTSHTPHHPYSYIDIVIDEYNWLEELKTTITDDVWLPDQVSSSLKTRQGPCQTIVNVLSTVSQ